MQPTPAQDCLPARSDIVPTDKQLEAYACGIVAYGGNYGLAYQKVFGKYDAEAAVQLAHSPAVFLMIQQLVKHQEESALHKLIVTRVAAIQRYHDICDAAIANGEYAAAIKAQDRILEVSEQQPVAPQQPSGGINVSNGANLYIVQTPPGVPNMAAWQQLTGTKPVIEHPPIENT